MGNISEATTLLLHFSIRTRIWGAILLTSALLLGSATMAIHISQNLGATIHLLAKYHVPLAASLNRLRSLEPERRDRVTRLLTLNPRDASRLAREVADRVDHFSALLAQELHHGAQLAQAMQNTLADGDNEERALLGDIATELSRLEEAERRLRQLLEPAIQIHLTPAKPAAPAALPPDYADQSAEVQQIQNHHEARLNLLAEKLDQVEQSIVQQAEETRQMETVLSVALFTCLTGSILLLTLLSRGIVRQIHQARDVALAISSNQLNVTIPQGAHEIGQLLDAMRSMVQALADRSHMEWLLRRSEKLSLLGRLAIGIAHEINNPLANAAMTTQLLRDLLSQSPQAETAGAKLDLVERNIDKAVSISRELLNFSRPEKVDFSPLSLIEPIEGALLLMEHKLKQVRVHWDLLATGEVNGMYGKLEQVFLNLFQNAVDAMPEGGELFISVFQAGDEVVAVVRDSGSGIAAEAMGKVFEPFFSTKPHSSGFGLGLPLCQSIIEQHNGSFDLTSAPGQGVTVTMRLPVSKERK